MISLAKLSIRRPKSALALSLILAIVLGLIGLGVDHSISPAVTTVRATDSYRAKQLAEKNFGPSQLIPILLEGPKAQLDREGPSLVVALTKRAHTRVLSAWDAGTASASLRPKPTAAMLVVSVDRSEKDVVKYDQPQIEKLVSRQIAAPVKAYISGQPSIDKALSDESLATLRHAALIGLGVLFILLMVGLRAPLAAILITLVAAATALSAFGLMTLIGKVMEVDAIAMATGAIAGLTRGSAFSIQMLDRFHRQRQADPARPLQSMLPEAIGTTGRAVLYAGTVMLAALILTDLLGPTDVLATLGIGAFVCTALATGAAVVVVPAALAVFGPVINDWRLPAPSFLSRGWDRMVAFGGPITRHAAATGALAAGLLVALAVPALAIKQGPQDIRQLPKDNKARIAFNEISRVMGPGQFTQYDVIVANPKGPITSAAVLSQLNQFETKIAKDKAVYSVVGPGVSFNPSATQLKQFGPSLQHSVTLSKQSKTDLLKLIDGLGQAGAGSAQLQAGLAAASSGAGQLQGGSGQAQSGAGQLHGGLAQAKSGSEQLAAGLNQALAGATALKNGASQALSGSAQITAGLGQAAPQVKAGLPAVSTMAGDASSTASRIMALQDQAKGAQGDVASALAALQGMSTGKSDPNYGAAVSALQKANDSASGISSGLGSAVSTANTVAFLAAGVKSQISKQLSPGLNQLYSGSQQLQAGIKQLRDGNSQLATGLTQLSGGGGQLVNGLGQLTVGAGALQTGLGQLTNGAGQLATGLGGGVGPAGQLTTGLGTMQAAVIKSRGQLPSTKDLETLFKQSPGMFNSGYFVLAAVAGASPADRNAASFALNLYRGGNAGQILITGRYPLSDKRSEQLGKRLTSMAAAFAKSSHLNVAVGGPAGSLYDTMRTAHNKLPWVIFGVAAGVGVLLALLLRSVLIPAIAIVCALLTTATSFGVIQLLFGGSNPPLDGPGTFDPITLTEVTATLFGATLLYLVLLLARTRDFYVASGDARASLVRAMRSTVAATSAAAATTIGILVPFMFNDTVPVRRIAVGAALAVGIVAFVILPVLLPAMVSLAGRFGWWPTHGPGAIAPERRRLRIPLPHLRLPHLPGHAH